MKKPSRRTLRILLLCIPFVAIFVSIAVASQSKSESKIQWHESMSEALPQGAPYDKPVMLRFYANWCMPCRVMDARVWPDDKVEAFVNENYIPIELNIDKPDAASLARKYGVRGVPTIITLDKNGKETGRANFMTTAQTLKLLERGLAKAE